MALTRRQIRANVGGKIGIVRTGTATSITGTTAIFDVSDDSPLDPGDIAERLSGSGLLVVAGSNIGYRQNVTYVPATQSITFAAVTGLTGTPYYEIHLEPLLHPLLDWPVLIDEALALIRRIVLKNILLTGRGYYDLAHWSDITGSEQVRRLYDVGPNMLQNGDFSAWPAGDASPRLWTATGTIGRANAVLNYGNGVILDATEALHQDIVMGATRRMIRASVWVDGSATAAGRLTLDARTAAGSQYTSVATAVADGTRQQLTVELEVAAWITTLRLQITETVGGQSSTFWAPMVYDVSQGHRHRVHPFTTLAADTGMKLYVPSGAGSCGEMALLLPYAGLGSAATDAADVATTAAPDKLIEAAVAVQVLAFLAEHPQVPTTSKAEYATALKLWGGKFRQRIRLHMRRIAKTQSVWEAGEIN